VTICSRCSGSGQAPEGRAKWSCPDCAGTGQVKLVTASIKCDQCDGRGLAEVETGRYVSGMAKKETVVCPKCGGPGQVKGQQWVPDL
jgi:DnaJ-class molecular chaperone